MNYIYRLTKRGLCSELNSLLGFYESVINEDCQVFIDAGHSQYFKSVSIRDVFEFPSFFVDSPCDNSTVISGNKWGIAAYRSYETKLTAQQINELFSYTDSFKQKLNENITKLSLPSKYNCFHVRRGDKVGDKKISRIVRKPEASKYYFQDYLKKSDQSIKTNFIMSDDYASIIESQQHGLKVKTLTTEEQIGHSTDMDINNHRHYGEKELVQFFSEIEIAKQSQQFIGTESSNIFRHIRYQCVKDVEFISLD